MNDKDKTPVVKHKNDSVTISKVEYEGLLKDRKWLYALEAAGVDNWEGYDIACDNYNEDES